FDAAKEFASILSLAPVVIFSKSYCPYCRATKELLFKTYELFPAPVVVELDKHPDGAALQDYIAEETGQRTVPNVIVGGVSRGGNDAMQKLHKAGQLADSFKSWSDKKVKVRLLQESESI
ncbi:hypothetical protein CANCADRAFT_13921, partial [Tortispora caseinolytica NRRL Y-17796]